MSKFQLHPVRASAIILILFSLGFSIYSFANAWVEPNTTPPGGNIAAPLHTGTTSQSKQGFLTAYGVEGYYPGNGAYGVLGYEGWGGYFNGGVYIYTGGPGADLSISYGGDNEKVSIGSWSVGGIHFYSRCCGFTDPSYGGVIIYPRDGVLVARNFLEVSSWDSQLRQGNGTRRRSIGGANGWDSNMLYLNGWGDWSSGVSVGGPGGASRLCLNGDCRSSWPSSDLYLPLAGGVMNAGSRVGFNGGTSYGIGQGAASPNLNSIAVDTLETDGGVGGGGTLELNYYGGNAVTIGPGGTKPLFAAIMYDGNNSGYYSDPNGTSRLNYGVFDNVYSYGWMQAPIFYDANDNGYYLDPNGTSRTNNIATNNLTSYGDTHFCAGNSTGCSTWFSDDARMIDDNDGNIRLHMSYGGNLRISNGGLVSDGLVYSSNYMQAPIFYDANNSGYYVDPASTTVLNVVYANQYNCMSDLELKKDIKPIGNALDKVLSIKGVSFTWKDEKMGVGNQVGVIAQDVEKVLPEVVTTNEQGLKAVDYSKLTPLIIESIKDLKIEKDQDVNNLREKIDNLEMDGRSKEEMINDLKRRIEALESK